MTNEKVLTSKFGYHLSKIAPFNSNITIRLKNGLKFIVRAKTMDRSVLKEVWLKNIYNRHAVKVEKGDTVIDIGGHIGIFSIYAAHRSETGKVYAFEPFKENFNRLQDHKAINQKENLFVFNKGVAATAGKKTLFLSPDKNTGGHSLHLKNQSERKVEIETINLLAFCDEHNISKIDFMKLDCEGAEFEILQSAEAILPRVKKIILECHPYGENTANNMVALLERNGYMVTRERNLDHSGIEMLYCKRWN
jgi:FkbM family methyltransferase